MPPMEMNRFTTIISFLMIIHDRFFFFGLLRITPNRIFSFEKLQLDK